MFDGKFGEVYENFPFSFLLALRTLRVPFLSFRWCSLRFMAISPLSVLTTAISPPGGVSTWGGCFESKVHTKFVTCSLTSSYYCNVDFSIMDLVTSLYYFRAKSFHKLVTRFLVTSSYYSYSLFWPKTKSQNSTSRGSKQTKTSRAASNPQESETS